MKYILVTALLYVNVHWIFFRNKESISDIIKGITAIGCFIIVIGGFYLYDSKNVIKTGSYYVNLFPEKSESKNYRVIGDVECDSESGECFLIKVTFLNGGYRTFGDYFGISPLIFYKQVTYKDDKGTYWNVELTKEKIEN